MPVTTTGRSPHAAATPPANSRRARRIRTALTHDFTRQARNDLHARDFFDQAARSARALEDAGVRRRTWVCWRISTGRRCSTPSGARLLLGAISVDLPVPDAQARRRTVLRPACATWWRCLKCAAVVTYGEMLPALPRAWTAPDAGRGSSTVDDLDASPRARPVLRARPIAARRHSFLQPLVRLDRPAKRRDALTRRGAEPDRRLQRRESV